MYDMKTKQCFMGGCYNRMAYYGDVLQLNLLSCDYLNSVSLKSWHPMILCVSSFIRLLGTKMKIEILLFLLLVDSKDPLL
jgi:hypothetical protein